MGHRSRGIGLGIFSLLILYLAFSIRRIFLSVFLAVFLTYLTRPLVEAFRRRKVPVVQAIFLSYIVIFLILGFLAAFLAPSMISELQEVGQTLPLQIQGLEAWLRQAYQDYTQLPLPPFLKTYIDESAQNLQALVEESVASLIGIILSVLRWLPSFLVAPVLSFYLIRDLDWFRSRLILWFPTLQRSGVQAVWSEVDEVLQGYIRGHLQVIVFVGTGITLGLSLLGLEFALLLGVLAGILDIIPYFGPILGAVPAVLLALTHSPLTALYVLLLFIGVNQMESAVLEPKIVGKRVGLHPILVILALLAGGELFGLVGMLVAIPVAGILRVLVTFLWRYWVNGVG